MKQALAQGYNRVGAGSEDDHEGWVGGHLTFEADFRMSRRCWRTFRTGSLVQQEHREGVLSAHVPCEVRALDGGVELARAAKDRDMDVLTYKWTVIGLVVDGPGSRPSGAVVVFVICVRFWSSAQSVVAQCSAAAEHHSTLVKKNE